MADTALEMFEDLDDYAKLQELVDGGEAEGLHLECKSPGAPNLSRELQVHLAKALSGFSNTDPSRAHW